MIDAGLTIRQNYHRFSKANRRIADFILRNPSEIGTMTANEIAEKSQTSPASVTRFARSVGFSGLDELKLSIASRLVGKETKQIDPIVSKDDSVEILCRKVGALLQSTIDDLLQLIDIDVMENAIAALRQAECIYLAGIGASSLTAYNLYHKFNRAGKKAVFNFDAHMNIEFLNYSSEKDVLIAVSYSGSRKEVRVACEIAKHKGTPVIFITKNDSKDIREISDFLLLVPDSEHIVRVGAISSVSASMAVGDMLYLGSIQDKLDRDVPLHMVETNELINRLKEE